MKLDFLTDFRDGPIIRLYCPRRELLHALADEIDGLAHSVVEEVDVHQLTGVDPLEGCKLTLKRVRNRPRSIISQPHPDAPVFLAQATPVDWITMRGLLDPFLADQHADSFQWLLGGDARGMLGGSDVALRCDAMMRCDMLLR